MALRPALLTRLLVLAAALLAHLSGGLGGFVYDDHRFIERNAALDTIRPWEYLVDPATASAASGEGVSADIYRPLRTLLFALERAVFDGPEGWHVVSALLHALNAGLLLLLLRTLLQAEGPAVVGALLFALHPVTVESVAWISSQGDLLALTLMLCTLLVLQRPGAARTLVGTALAALACLAKESAVVLPALLLLRDRALAPEAALPRRTTLVRVAVLAAVVVGYFVLRGAVLPGDLAQVDDPGLSAKARGFLAATTWYAGALLWPSGFRFETDLLAPLAWSEPAVLVGVSIWLTVLSAGLLAWRRGRPAPLLFGLLGAAAALVPVSQVVVPLKTLAAERFLYPVLPCLAAAVGAGALALGRRWGAPFAWAPLVLAIPFSVLTVQRTEAWQEEETLWDAVHRDRPTNARAYEGLGKALMDKKRFRDGERAYRSYFEAEPFDGKAHFMFATQYLSELARMLDSSDRDWASDASTMPVRRGELLALVMVELGRALSIWDDVGLAAGRGGPLMRQEALERLANAGLELAALAEQRGTYEGYSVLERVRWANDRLIALTGVDPDDPADVGRRAPFPLRVMRWNLAWKGVTPPREAAGKPGHERMLAFRAESLRDVGLDPERNNDVVFPALEQGLRGLLAEAEAAWQAAPRGPARRRAYVVLDNLLRMHMEVLVYMDRLPEAEGLRVRLQQLRLAELGPGGP